MRRRVALNVAASFLWPSIGLFTLSGCMCASNPTPEEQARLDLSAAETRCANASIAYARADGQIALAQVDQAIGENVDQFTPRQEREIRALLGREMGLPPSQVNGWREIYRARARNAQARRAEEQREANRLRQDRDDACHERDRLAALVR